MSTGLGLFVLAFGLAALAACDSTTDVIDDDDDTTPATLHPAFADFDTDNVSVMLDGDDVLIESNGYPNHVSPYWSPTHPLYVDPTVADRLTPGFIDDFVGSVALTVSASPERASFSTATGLGPIGIAVSGAMIYNDQEGPNVPIDNALGSLDYTGAHRGPGLYHYHLEPKAWSDDDDALIGVMADGFFLYGRREPDGTYPTDLDASGGHVGPTPHNPDGEYHYHIQNEVYLGQYYILFPGDYQGTPNAIR
ncbi:MAG: YHYH protein [Bacteroidota bacterium]